MAESGTWSLMGFAVFHVQRLQEAEKVQMRVALLQGSAVQTLHRGSNVGFGLASCSSA